ncbi:MAG: BACON domain-containing protein, partial [Planctomycetota bacterium]
PSQYSTIQAAIDHSWNDGTVCVADGTYAGLGNRDIDFKGKAIHVRSENGPESCIIDCGASKFDRHCGFRFLGGEDGNSVLEGFTITNGYAYYGGGIYCEQSSPTIVNCILSENVAEKGGYGCGGGLYCIDSNMALVNCTFRDNTAEEDGGGMESVDWSRPTLTNCRFYGNVVSGPHYASGGGMHCCSRTRPVITNCIFSGNSACGRNARGGGLYSILNNIEVTNCIFTGNHADYEGGGMLSGYECNATITNCTFSGNSAGSGGGLFNYGNSDTALINCILWGNSDSGGMDESAQIFDDDIYVIKYCCIQGWTRGGEGNIDVDPCFVEPGYWDGDTWIDGDYHLLSGSACIDAGNSYYCMRLPCTDCHGYVRLVGERIDMGCYEFGSSPDTDGDWLADNSESGYEDNPDRDNDGILDGLEILRGTEPDVFDPLGRWNIPADADIIQEALFLSRDGEIIALSEGTYHQSIYIGGRNVTLTSSDPLDPNVVAATIINGDTDINPLTRNGPVIIFAGTENSSCQLRGLTITGGYSSRGAGIRGAGTAAGITYCTITGNRAYDDGGGVYGCAGPISYCTITSNQAGDKGGGIYGDQYDGPISNCTIAGNSAGEDGGGLKYCAGPITRCTITGNSAGDDGGGMHACDHARLTNCVITGNVAGDDGGGMYKCDYDTINNCTITGNSANDRGGGIYYRGGSYLITNCIIWNDAPDGPQIYLEDMDDVSIVFSNVKGGWEGQGNIDADPLFVDAVGGDYRLSSDSPCIDAGTNDLDVLPATDIEGTPRPLDGDGDGSILADMGAYEYWVPVEAPVIEVSTSIIRFSAVDDQANPDDQVLSIRNWGQGTLIWEITEDCPWLEISPRNGESTGEFDDAVLSVDVARLRPGDRSCVLTVSGDGAVNSPRMVKVSLDVQGRILELSSNEFRFSYGDSNPYDQTLFVWNAGPGTLVWQITEDCPWLGVAPTSGESSGEKDDVILSVDGNGMPVGDYYCALTVSAVDADNSPQTVDVILDIIGSIVSLSQDQFEFTAGKSSPRPLDQNLSISNVGFRTLNWEITIPAGCDWLQVSPMIGTCGVGETNKVVLTVHADGLDYGSYSCELAVSDPNAENSPQTVGVNLNVLGPLISIEPDSLEFVVPKNGPGPPSRILRIGNGGYDTLHWEVSVPSGCGWLQVYPVTGESGGEFDDVTVSVDTAGLACGMYSCAVTISAADAENSPQSVEVNLLVNMIRSVPTAEYPTVQAAIDGATNGDVVIVADGVYTGAGNRDIDFGGKAITVRSENGPANCIVDCQGTAPEPHRGFYFHSGE